MLQIINCHSHFDGHYIEHPWANPILEMGGNEDNIDWDGVNREAGCKPIKLCRNDVEMGIDVCRGRQSPVIKFSVNVFPCPSFSEV